MVSRRTFVKGLAATPVVGSALFAVPRVGAQDDPIRVGSKDFVEQFILGNMYLMLLENAGLPVENELNLGGTGVAHEALVAGEIDLYPEYTGTGLTVVLGIPLDDLDAMATPVPDDTTEADSLDQRVYDYVSEQYRDQFNLVWLDRSLFNNNQALAVKRAFAEEHNLTTISDLAELTTEMDITISAPVDFEEREDGLVGLQRVYGNFDVEVNGVAPGIKYQAFLDDEAEVVLAFGTDGEIFGYDLIVLEDDRGLIPPAPVAPVVRQETLDAYPEIPDILNPLASLLTDDVMSGLNWQVAGEANREPDEVAHEFLVETGLL